MANKEKKSLQERLSGLLQGAQIGQLNIIDGNVNELCYKKETASTDKKPATPLTHEELAKAVVQGRGAEKYLQEQIDYVNQKRGIDPKDLQNRDRIKLQNIESAIDRRDELENPKPKTIGKGKGIGV